jgi:hypothetical protein
MYEFLRGPMVWVSVLVFLGGIVFRVAQFFALSKKKKERCYPSRQEKGSSHGSLSPEERRIQRIIRYQNSVIGRYPLVTLATSLFHILIFIIPLFLLAHNNLLHESWKIRLWSFPEAVADTLTLLFLGIAVFFFFRRVVLPRVRSLTTVSDYAVLIITAGPFLTGFIAYHQWFEYRSMVILHLITGEVMLIAVTFTKLGHMIFFFLARFFVGKEYSFGKGRRAW